MIEIFEERLWRTQKDLPEWRADHFLLCNA